MFNSAQALAQVKTTLPEVKIKAWTEYRQLYLVRVEYPYPGEQDYDPFFSVNKVTGEVRDFSVLTDGDLSEISALQWEEVR
jgi:hypothetical protein